MLCSRCTEWQFTKIQSDQHRLEHTDAALEGSTASAESPSDWYVAAALKPGSHHSIVCACALVCGCTCTAPVLRCDVCVIRSPVVCELPATTTPVTKQSAHCHVLHSVFKVKFTVLREVHVLSAIVMEACCPVDSQASPESTVDLTNGSGGNKARLGPPLA